MVQYIEYYPTFDRNSNPVREIIGCDFNGADSTFNAVAKTGASADTATTMGSSLSSLYESDSANGWSVDTISMGYEDDEMATGQFVVNCTITKNFAKINRDNSIFMDYKGTAGAMKVAGSTPTDWGSETFTFHLDEPIYDFGEVGDDDYIVQPMDIVEMDVWAEDIDSSKTGLGIVTTQTDYLLSPYFFADDVLRATFMLDLPESMLPNDYWVYQYVQLTPDNDPGSLYISITCAAQVNKDNTQRIKEH